MQMIRSFQMSLLNMAAQLNNVNSYKYLNDKSNHKGTKSFVCRLYFLERLDSVIRVECTSTHYGCPAKVWLFHHF